MCWSPFSQARCKHSAGALLGKKRWAPIQLLLSPHLSVPGRLVSRERVCPQQAAPCRWSSARLPHRTHGQAVSSLSPAFLLSVGQPLPCLLLQSTLWLLIFPETYLSHCFISCTPGLTGEASLLHDLSGRPHYPLSHILNAWRVEFEVILAAVLALSKGTPLCGVCIDLNVCSPVFKVKTRKHVGISLSGLLWFCWPPPALGLHALFIFYKGLSIVL